MLTTPTSLKSNVWTFAQDDEEGEAPLQEGPNKVGFWVFEMEIR